MVVDAITIVVAILLAGLGVYVGFGRTLRFFVNGIFGTIISIVFCVAFGGMIASIGPIAEGISWLNNWLGGVWDFFATIRLATIIYYVVLFLLVQLLRKLIVLLLEKLFSMDLLAMRILNGALGAVLMVVAVFILLLLVLAIFELFGTSAFVQDMLVKLDGTFIKTLYLNNPIDFTQIFANNAQAGAEATLLF